MIDSPINKKRKLNYNDVNTASATTNEYKSLPISEYTGILPNKDVIDFISNVGLLSTNKRINVIETIDGDAFLELLGNREFMDKPIDQRSTNTNRIIEKHFYSDRWIKVADYNKYDNQYWWRNCTYFKTLSDSKLGLFSCFNSMQGLPNHLKDHIFSNSTKIQCENMQSVILEQLLYSLKYPNFESISLYNKNYQNRHEDLNKLKSLNAVYCNIEFEIDPLFYCNLIYITYFYFRLICE